MSALGGRRRESAYNRASNHKPIIGKASLCRGFSNELRDRKAIGSEKHPISEKSLSCGQRCDESSHRRSKSICYETCRY